MNKVEFMKQLESLLQGISSAEREEALQYYNEYFNDAGAENEQDVLEALGNPARVAENIKRDLYGNGYGDNVRQQSTIDTRAVVPYEEAESAKRSIPHPVPKKKEGGMPVWLIVLLVLLGIILLPLTLSIYGTILGALVSVVITWFALILALGIIAVSFIVVLFILLVTGIICMFSDPLAGMIVLGIGLIFGGVGILALMLTVAMAGIATPAIGKGIVRLFR